MPNAMIEVACPVCGHETYKILHQDTLNGRLPVFNYNFTPKHNLTYRIVQCQKCTHAYASPRHECIWQEYTSVEDDVYLSCQQERLVNASNIVEKIHKIKPSGRLLDVGCATGDFLEAARKYYQVEGLELSEWSSRIAEQRGFKIHKLLLDHMTTKNDYDIVSLWGVIEHFEFPSKEVANIARILKPGGIVVLWTGDIDSLTSRILGRKWWYHQGQHIQMFSKKSLRTVFTQNGFTEVRTGIYPYVRSMRSIGFSLGRYPWLGGIARRVLNLSVLRNRMMTIALPGEMFAIFQKKAA